MRGINIKGITRTCPCKEGAHALRRRLLLLQQQEEAKQEPEIHEAQQKPERGKQDGEIFVSVIVYRNPEAEHTLRGLFERARHPERIRVGVVWTYKTEPRSADQSGRLVVDRMHRQTNMMTGFVEREASKISDPVEQRSFIEKTELHQAKCQKEEEEEERRCHCKATCVVPERWRGQIRERHVSWEESEGPCYARHMATQMWGGEDFVLQVDSSTRFEQDWDAILEDELRKCPDGGAKTVLTACPLGYALEEREVVDDDGLNVVGRVPVPGTLAEHKGQPGAAASTPPDGAPPAAPAAHRFGARLCHMAGRLLRRCPDRPVPVPFVSTDFLFAQAGRECK